MIDDIRVAAIADDIGFYVTSMQGQYPPAEVALALAMVAAHFCKHSPEPMLAMDLFTSKTREFFEVM